MKNLRQEGTYICFIGLVFFMFTGVFAVLDQPWIWMGVMGFILICIALGMFWSAYQLRKTNGKHH